MVEAEYSGFYRRLRQTVEQGGCLKAGEALLLAVSGGVDSVLLLDFILWLRARYAAQGGLKLAVFHFNHQLRAEAAADAAFVAELARAAELPFYSDTADCRALAAVRAAGLEEACRFARYQALAAALADWSERCGQPAAAVLGHHLDDQAETVLLNLARGCGLDGLTAMRAVEGVYRRPLLSLSRAEIEAFARQRGLVWREDRSNDSPAFQRNRLRQTLLPYWSELCGQPVARKLAEVAEHCQAERAVLAELATNWLAQAALPDGALNLKLLQPLQPALVLRILRQWLGARPDAPTLNRAQQQQFLNLLKRCPTEGRMDLSGPFYLQIRHYRLSLAEKPS